MFEICVIVCLPEFGSLHKFTSIHNSIFPFYLLNLTNNYYDRLPIQIERYLYRPSLTYCNLYPAVSPSVRQIATVFLYTPHNYLQKTKITNIYSFPARNYRVKTKVIPYKSTVTSTKFEFVSLHETYKLPSKNKQHQATISLESYCISK